MKKILLVDDNEHDRMLYRRLLRKQAEHQEFQVFEADSGEMARVQFAAHRPDCVLLDYNLPDTDGLELLLDLKQLAPDDSLCVVMITGGGSEALAVKALNNGALDYLVKQHFDHELLFKTVMHAIEKNEWRQRVAEHHQQLQAVNQQLARTNRDLDNFVYAASHDLRQPVNNLRGLFDELRRSASFDDPDQAVILGMVDASLDALSTTITDLAAVVQMARPEGEQTTEPVALADLTADVLQTLHPQLQAVQADVETDFEELPELEYVRSNLRTILLNLLSNAVKYRHPDRAPRVALRTTVRANQPVLEVQDNGLGMDLERHGPELFQLFRRFHPHAGEGTGVGLFLVNRLVQAHGGRIEVESEEGQGTTFRVHLRG
ncbi:hybrid sensor histidine kinase/response regulator [Hymenobacter sp. 15J16-1T3B]|uniref:ATP-binding protein n=1 Tax=Hymenobacter sp. 15J16-1T3B TaxID=2886941 RepID=UPI001D0FAB0B|nr:hybrid sensor histidine kinase/response regulator [Hymenobacter sp. 15J16-1T3B]MCC3160475.1 hybrid sensor histidine kinase/response regulator [Hymenobacter sp. 15J16-1T3B]